MTDLALFTKSPLFSQPVFTGRPNLGDQDRLFERIRSALDSARLSNNGPLVREFEENIAAKLGVQHCIAFCNATIGLESLLLALNLRGEVIVPSFTFVATVHAVRQVGLTPVFCDVDPVTHCLDPAHVADLITSRTAAILGVHLWGTACAISELTALAAHHHLPLLYDAAHAFSCSHRNRMIGGFGTAEVLSFHATKLINCGEGGAVTTDDPQLAARLRLIRNFGFADKDTVTSLGTNGKMPELSAAMGLTNLEECDRFIAANELRRQAYAAGLVGLPGIQLHSCALPGDRNHGHYTVIEVDPDSSHLTRDELLTVLTAENIHARRYFHPGVHHHPPYLSLAPRSGPLTVTDTLSSTVLVLPTGCSLPLESVTAICEIIRIAQAEAPRIRAELYQRTATATRSTLSPVELVEL